MKKKICVLMILFLSFFVCLDKVDAGVVMYLDCPVHPDCSGASEWKGYTESRCQTDIHKMARLTNASGESTIRWINGKEQYLLKCWLKGDNFSTSTKSGLFAKCSDNTKYSDSINNIFSSGACPIASRMNFDFRWFGIDGSNNDDTDYVAYGKTRPEKTVVMEHNEYIAYKFRKNGKLVTYVEGYDKNGEYFYIGPARDEGGTFSDDEVMEHQVALISNVGADNFFRVSTNFNSLIIAGKGKKGAITCSSASSCQQKYGYEVIFDSNDSNGNLKQTVIEWYNDNERSMESYNPLVEIAKNETFMNTTVEFEKALNQGREYNFSSSYTMNNFIDDLEKAYYAIKSAYGDGTSNNAFKDAATGKETSLRSSVTSYVMWNVFGVENVEEIAAKDNEKYYTNIGEFLELVYADSNSILEKYLADNQGRVDVLNVSKNLTDYTARFYKIITYLRANANSYGVSLSQLQKIENLYASFYDLVELKELNLHPVVDCESLLGKDLIDEINSYLDIVKIAIPIILIGFGVLDFTKAIFAGDESVMKKAKDAFLKRILISVLIFLAPTFVNLLLTLANKVWPIISPGSCGLFE